MATATSASTEEVNDFLREVSRRIRPRPTTRQRESRTATNQYQKRLAARSEFEQTSRQQNLAYAQALGQERAANAALREQSVLQARRQSQAQANRAAIPGAIAGGAARSVVSSGPSQAIFGSLGALMAAIAIAIILYILLHNAQGVSGTTNSIMNWVMALTSTNPLFTSSQSSGTQPASGSPNAAAGTNKGGAK